MRTIDQQMREMLQTPGVRSVCLVDWRGGRTLAHLVKDGASGEDDGGADATALLRAVHGGPLGAVPDEDVEDVVVTGPDHHVLLAVLAGSDLCMGVRMMRDEGNLGFALVRLRGLARTAQVPQPRRGLPRSRPGPRGRAGGVDRRVLERVLTALHALPDRPGTAGAVVA
ncbi:hypothetical protein FHS13_000034 [Nocardiopsis algeriensis]|uniref:Roadblock/LAMTOR2 domain-containing protein n=2 Tax=Nocardiopsis algeriensis TaxID=1478215 RepID=A0A841ILJ2_9ACTN|nr:hypothetical protein [Nocardiopsis algeriensis]